jgi:hypothetical protein
MTTNNDHDHIVSQYLNRLEAALKDVPADERESLVESIATHISEARATLSPHSEAAVRDILDRIGDPADIAREMTSQHLDLPAVEPRHRAPRRRAMIAIIIAGTMVLAALAAFFAVRSPTPVSPPVATTTTVRATAPKGITVPDVIGLTVTQAVSSLTADTFGYQADYQCSTTQGQASTVTAQSPRPGQRAKRGSFVRFTIGKTCNG